MTASTPTRPSEASAPSTALTLPAQTSQPPAPPLVRYETMCRAIAECHRIDEVKDLRDQARALEVYAQQARNTEAEDKAWGIRLRAERRMGELLIKLKRLERAERAQQANVRLGFSDHADISPKIRSAIQELEARGIYDLSPSSIASQIYSQYGNALEDHHVVYACIEHLKQMTRRVLAAKFDPDCKESCLYQLELFFGSLGSLQKRYPIPKKRGEAPIYKPLTALTASEIDWNIAQLNKSADARRKHADELLIYRSLHFAEAA